MHISFNWLKELVALEVDADELTKRMTMLGLEIEAVVEPGKEITDVFTGRIVEITPHPDADKLVVCKTDVGQGEPLQIVCGAKNMKVGDVVPTAVDGAMLPGGFKIARRKMRGMESCGMMCSARELNLGGDHSGLMILDPDTPVGRDIRPLLGLDDMVFEIEVTPNRGDWAGMIGVARELAAYYGVALTLPKIVLTESGASADSLSSVTIEDAELCPRYAGRILRNVVIKSSPPWLCARLQAAGQRPINNVVDITNYVLLETGHPLHAFDYDKLAEHRIVVRRARAGESITTLDGEVRSLTESMLVIADAHRPQAVAGIMGGADSEVDEATKTILLEAAYFNPRSVRATARSLGLLTEAAQHFQRGADPEMVLYAINRAAMLMQELADAEIAPGILDEYPIPQSGAQVTLRYARTGKLLGTEIPPEKQRVLLTGLGFSIVEQNENSCMATAPTWRHDVSHEADLIEEVARHYGYENIPNTMPPVRQNDIVFAPMEMPTRTLRRLLAAQGLTEVVNWSFGNPDSEAKAGIASEDQRMVMLANPLSENYSGMRTSLLPGLLATAAYNHRRGTRSCALFEMGPVYHAQPNESLPEEPSYLGILLSGVTPGIWHTPERPFDFYDIKGHLEAAFNFMGREFALEPLSGAPFQEGQGALVKWRKTCFGKIGKIAPAMTKSFDLSENVFVLELDLNKLFAAKTPPAQFEDIPQFPASVRDLAVVIERTLTADALLKTAREAGGPLLRQTSVFDVYTGKPLPPDKKSVALSFLFQSPERTLKDEDIQKAMERIMQRLKQQHGAELR